MTTTTSASGVTDHEREQVERANATGLQPVAFVHGLWLLPSSWDRWSEYFEQAGYAGLTPGWPDDPATVEEAKANPDVFAHKSVGQIADHVEEVIGGLDKTPVIIGHSFGGGLGEILARRGGGAAPGAVSPPPVPGGLPPPRSAPRSAPPGAG